ncbi:MAG: PLP-dependent aminotransferase family protein, partial [Granulosicoccaceae bacterium]
MPKKIQFARRMQGLVSSPIRDILAAAQRPEVISFAGGLPATELLPSLEDWQPPVSAGQYGPSEGEPELRHQVAELLRARGLEVSAEQVLITAGSQQGIDLVAK